LWKLFKYSLLLTFLLCGNGSSAAPVVVDVCPKLTLEGPERIGFSSSELLLLCGDPANEAWKTIPPNQAVFHLRTFLQDRGYYFAEVRQEGSQTVVNIGEATIVRELQLDGNDPLIRLDRIRAIQGKKLTPQLLNDLEGRVREQLQTTGVGCPQYKVEGFPKSGIVRVTVVPEPPQTVGKIDVVPVEGLDRETWDRFHAFKKGYRFDGEAMQVTTNRIHTQGIVQQAYFQNQCKDGEVHIRQETTVGAPRVVTIGVGVNTELGAGVKASWRHARLWHLGSTIDLSGSAFYRGADRNVQEFKASMDWFYLSSLPRHSIQPSITIRHESQQLFRLVSLEAKALAAFTWDWQTMSGIISVGPSGTATRLLRGVGRQNTYAMAFDTNFGLMSHDYELYRTAPRSGFDIMLKGTFSEKGILSDITARTVKLEAHKLWNIGQFLPPVLVFALRFGAAITHTDDTGTVPPNLKHYLGGSRDLRGFSLLEAPGPEGALTAWNASAELRLADGLPWKLQPITFVDLGMTGSRPMMLNSPLMLSPGLGLRWESPVGVFRTTLARGILFGQGSPQFAATSHWQFFLSFGEEF
jgi:hypothetical protein